jgi:hypothetical protein
MANNIATVILVTKQGGKAFIMPYTPHSEEKLIGKKVQKSLGQHPEIETYRFAVINSDDRKGLAGQLLHYFGPGYLLGRAEHLSQWAMSADWYEQRSFLASPLELVAEIDREIWWAQLGSGENGLSQASTMLEKARRSIASIESVLYRREYRSLVGAACVGEVAARTIIARACETESTTAFQVAYGSSDFLTIGFCEVIPSWIVIAVEKTTKRDVRLPFFNSEVGNYMIAKNLTPPQSIGSSPPPGAIRIGEYNEMFQEGGMWIKTAALKNRFDAMSFAAFTGKQMVKLINVPVGARVSLI